MNDKLSTNYLSLVEKLSISCSGKNKFQIKYTIIYSNQFKDEYGINEFSEQQDL